MSDVPEELRQKLCLALDVDDLVAANRLARDLKGHFGVVKVGLELFTAVGPDVIGTMTDHGYRVFVDQLTDLRPLSAAQRQAIETFLGEAADLDDVLARTVPADNNRAARTLVFEAVATDGYRAVFTWGEIFNSAAGDQVLVISAQDGRALGNEQGPLALRALADLRPGPRHVRNLCGLVVR